MAARKKTTTRKRTVKKVDEVKKAPSKSSSGKSVANLRLGSSLKKAKTLKKLSRGKLIAIVILLLIIGAAYYYKGLFVAAMVNNQPITRVQVIGMLEKRQGSQALDNLITETLIKQEAQKNNITVSQDEVDQKISDIETNLKAQGQTLDSALAFQGMTRDDLNDQVKLQTLVEKILKDQVSVSDDDVDKYIKDNGDSFPSTMSSDDMKTQAKSQLEQQALSDKYQTWINDLKSNADIKYFVEY